MLEYRGAKLHFFQHTRKSWQAHWEAQARERQERFDAVMQEWAEKARQELLRPRIPLHNGYTQEQIDFFKKKWNVMLDNIDRAGHSVLSGKSNEGPPPDMRLEALLSMQNLLICEHQYPPAAFYDWEKITLWLREWDSARTHLAWMSEQWSKPRPWLWIRNIGKAP